MNVIRLVPPEEFTRIRTAMEPGVDWLPIFADMCRINTLNAVKRAGSGHLGSSFSAMEIVVWLYFRHMNTLKNPASADRDIYFSSKGHDVPGLYAVLHAAGIISTERLLGLRRLGGLDGHPDVSVPGIEANSGSLGMGISKGRGLAWGKRYLGRDGHVFVLTGDGELQEGQNYEALQTTIQQKVSGLTVIVDHNKVQTDRPVHEITDLQDLEAKFASFGWCVEQCDGHDFEALEAVFSKFRTNRDRPKLLIAHTIKGRGVSFMEHPVALADGGGIYRWHAGAPDDNAYAAAHSELVDRVNAKLRELHISPLRLIEFESAASPASSPREYVADAYGTALVAEARRRRDLIVLDGDLAADCRIREFEREFGDRFIENGIAEQDMVSMAGALARSGLLPVVNTFASFLAARANEQIYNNATERTKVIYVCHYAGLIPAGPGKSHQSVRDISLFAALPNVTILQPCNSRETELAVQYCVRESAESCVLRLVIGPSPRSIELPADYQLVHGRGVLLRGGSDAILFAYGPVMLHEALSASEMLAEHGFGLAIANMPWLNRVDPVWLRDTVSDFRSCYILDDHAPAGGLGDHLLSAMVANGLAKDRDIEKLGVDGFPACGAPAEVLAAHGLDAASLAVRIVGRPLSALELEPAAGMVYTTEAPQ